MELFKELMRSFLLVFVAEMGDKTQIIAMTLATQFSAIEVLIGVAIGVFFNHGIAIVLGKYISKIVPLNLIQVFAGLLFVAFGVLALIGNEDKEKEKSHKNLGPIITVAIAFFVGELGDKTQLTAMTLSTEGQFPLFILMGTTLGMVAVSGLGIFVGSKIGEKVPEIIIKIISSAVFLSFGTIKLFQSLPKHYLTPINIVLYFVLLTIVVLTLLRKLIIKNKMGEKSALKEAANILYKQTKELQEAIDNICLGEDTCGKCVGNKCIVGYTKKILEESRNNSEYYVDDMAIKNVFVKGKNYNKKKAAEALSLIILDYINYGIDLNKNYVINQTRVVLEQIIFGKDLGFQGDIDEYLKTIRNENKLIWKVINNTLNEKNR